MKKEFFLLIKNVLKLKIPYSPMLALQLFLNNWPK